MAGVLSVVFLWLSVRTNTGGENGRSIAALMVAFLWIVGAMFGVGAWLVATRQG